MKGLHIYIFGKPYAEGQTTNGINHMCISPTISDTMVKLKK